MSNDQQSGTGHNHPPDPDGERGREAMRDYNLSLAKEQVEREGAIAAAVRYGAVLRGGRAGRSNNEFGDWIVAQGLDRHPIFEYAAGAISGDADRRNCGPFREGNG